jgi:hypothetical protein
VLVRLSADAVAAHQQPQTRATGSRDNEHRRPRGTSDDGDDSDDGIKLEEIGGWSRRLSSKLSLGGLENGLDV